MKENLSSFKRYRDFNSQPLASLAKAHSLITFPKNFIFFTIFSDRNALEDELLAYFLQEVGSGLLRLCIS